MAGSYSFLASDKNGPKTEATDVWALPLFGDHEPFPVVETPGVDYYGTFSADGKWVAYKLQQIRSGRNLYEVPFPGPGGKWQIIHGRRICPFWPQGKELFFTPDFRDGRSGIFSIEGTNF